MADALHSHRAGAELPRTPPRLFRWETHECLSRAHLASGPLDVGADRIRAHSPYTALGVLGCAKPAATPDPRGGSRSPIEVVSQPLKSYPAGTPAAWPFPILGVKKPTSRRLRAQQQLVDAVPEELLVDDDAAILMVQSDHALDAVLWTIAGLEFLGGDVLQPSDLVLANVRAGFGFDPEYDPLRDEVSHPSCRSGRHPFRHRVCGGLWLGTCVCLLVPLTG